MDEKRAIWNKNHNLLREIILKTERIEEAKELCLLQHAMVHASEMSGLHTMTLEDEVWEGLDDFSFRHMPTFKDETIAWSIWHLSRIEDITMNMLVADGEQVICKDDWLSRMSVSVRDTGNTMTDDEIIDLSNRINRDALREYRIAVGRRTRYIIANLSASDMKRKIKDESLQRILAEGGVLKEAYGIIDFWGRKNVAGLLLMPATRHHVLHLNESIRIKVKCARIKKRDGYVLE